MKAMSVPAGKTVKEQFDIDEPASCSHHESANLTNHAPIW
jgi:hypothetical protein